MEGVLDRRKFAVRGGRRLRRTFVTRCKGKGPIVTVLKRCSTLPKLSRGTSVGGRVMSRSNIKRKYKRRVLNTTTAATIVTVGHFLRGKGRGKAIEFCKYPRRRLLDKGMGVTCRRVFSKYSTTID